MDKSPVSTQALPPGTRIEEFAIERVLGAGGFGITYLARDSRLDRQVVIKENLPVQFCFRDTHSLTVAPRHTTGEDAENFRWSLENFSRESAMLASLDHPGIVKVLRSFQAFGTAYFVMPYVEGVALDELAKARAGAPFPEKELRKLLERVLAALGYLHDRGIYHRDIKPGNILITNEGIPVLIDFGSARKRISERSMTVVESAGYTPFEQLQTRGNVGPWSDLYALAATLVKVMTGEAPPKANDRTMGDPWQPLAGREELKDRCSQKFLQCLDRALKLPTEERWQSAEDLKKALEGNSLPAAIPAPVLDAATKPADSPRLPNWRRVAVWAMGLSLMIAAGIYGYWHFGQGTVRIASDPPGAVVMLDGHTLGTTPVLLAPLPPFSDWQVEIRMDGYEMETMRGRVAWRERSVAPPRQLRALPQNVLITSEPLGAEVFDGDKSLGITPWESAPIPVGTVISYHLRLRGYDDQHATARVKTGETLRLTVRMEPEKWFAAKATAEERLRLAESGDAYAQALLGYEKFFGPKEGLSADEIASCTKEGEAWIRKSAAQKHPLGSALLGSVHVRNGGLNASGPESIILEFKSAVENGLIANPNPDDPIWTNWIGLAYQYGRGVAENKVEAVNCFRKAAEAGLADAMDSLGRCYHLGEGVTKDAAEAAKWFRKAAEAGSADGMYSLGRCYHIGEGVTKDVAEAAKWYLKAAEAGSAGGMRFVGCCYRLGEGVTKDAAEAAKWYLKAAEAGSAIGMDILGWCYTKGEGVTKDSAEAAKWFRKAADAGLVGGMLRLAECYSSGEGVDKDAAEAAKWFRKAAEAGSADGMFSLGRCYYQGEGVDKDATEAAKWFRKAAEAGSVDGMFSLGRCYHEGEGVTKDAAEAAKWYLKAAEAGDADGMVNLGRCYHLGEGVTKDAAEAAKWYLKAAEAGDADGMVNLGRCYHLGEGVTKDAAEAVKWYRKAEEQGLAGAQYALGVCYANGEGVKRDYNKALEFANKAKAGGHDCDDLIKHLTAQIKSQANAKTNTTPESLSAAISKPKDKHSMPVYRYSERHRVVRTTAYTRSESDVYGTKNAAGTNPRYTDKVRSAAADWSFYPIGTVFRVKGMQQLFVIDDYDLTLIGTGTIGMYQPSLDMMKSWGCRNIEISIVQWGSFERSAEILKDRTKFPHCRQMLSNIIRQRPDLNRR